MIKLIPKIFGGKTTKKKKKAPAKPAPPSTIEQIEAASTALEKAVGPQESAESGAVMTEREKLIQNALAIHREKSKLLDSLPPAVRTKLTAMAMAIFIKQRADNDKN
ncbi:MAG: hypothetical protein WD407_11080 [Rhodospirillales bacterium]